MGDKTVLFTFDYELFLGQKSGSVQKCLLDPTRKLLDIFDDYHIEKAIFFIDTTYLIRLKEVANNYERANHDWQQITRQLQDISMRGHYLYLHLHPHWLDAVYNEDRNEWSLADLSKYRFNHLSVEQKELIFKESIEILKKILVSINQPIHLDGFRAGGWSLQPFKSFRPYFENYGIVYDFSLLPGKHQFTNAQFYDYRIWPNKPVYPFSDMVEREDVNGPFRELTITTIPYPRFLFEIDKLWQKILWRLRIRSLGDGNGVTPEVLNNYEYPVTDKECFLERASFELLNQVSLPLYKNYIAKNNYIHFISHPKMLSHHNFYTLEKLLYWMDRHFTLHTDFKKIVQG